MPSSLSVDLSFSTFCSPFSLSTHDSRHCASRMCLMRVVLRTPVLSIRPASSRSGFLQPFRHHFPAPLEVDPDLWTLDRGFVLRSAILSTFASSQLDLDDSGRQEDLSHEHALQRGVTAPNGPTSRLLQLHYHTRRYRQEMSESQCYWVFFSKAL